MLSLRETQYYENKNSNNKKPNKFKWTWAVVVHTINHSSQETEAGRCLGLKSTWSTEKVLGQPGLYRNTILKNTIKNLIIFAGLNLRPTSCLSLLSSRRVFVGHKHSSLSCACCLGLAYVPIYCDQNTDRLVCCFETGPFCSFSLASLLLYSTCRPQI